MIKNTSSGIRIDFMFVGVPRSATTWFYKVLQEHPEICVPKKKEFVPFDTDGNIKDSLGNQFGGCNKKKKGLFPISFFLEKDGAKMLKKHFPNTKIIFCIRNPIERAYSHYKYEMATGALNLMDFDTFIKNDLKNKRVLHYGLYAKAIKEYEYIFGKENILIVQYDNIKNNPKKTINKVCDFIGIDSDFKSIYTMRCVGTSNQKFYKERCIKYIINSILNFSNAIKSVALGKSVIVLAKQFGAKRFLDILNSMRSISISKSIYIHDNSCINNTIYKVLKDYYQEDIDKTRTIINRRKYLDNI